MNTIKSILPVTKSWFQKGRTTVSSASSATSQGSSLPGDTISPLRSKVTSLLSGAFRHDGASEQDRFKNAKKLLEKNPWRSAEPFSSLTSIPEAKRRLMLVTRWENNSCYDPKQNDSFALKSAQDIEIASQKIRDGTVTTFDQLWEMARASRITTLTERERQLHTYGAEFESFSRCRDGESALHMQGQYQYITRNLNDQVKSIFRATGCTAQIRENDDGYYYTCLRALEKEEKARSKDGSNVSPSATVRHITISKSDNPNSIIAVLRQVPPGALVGDTSRITKSMGHFKFQVFENRRPEWALCHDGIDQKTYTKTVLKIHQQYQDALAAPTPENMLKEAHRAFRTSVLAMLDERGTAAKAHFCLQAVLLSRGFVLPPAKEGLAPDLECLTSTEDEWVNDRARTVFQPPDMAPNSYSSQ